MATLRTLGWTSLENKEVLEELLIPFDRIVFVQKHEDDTCLVSVSERRAVLVDIPLKQMRRILKEIKENPFKEIDAHPFDDDDLSETGHSNLNNGNRKNKT